MLIQDVAKRLTTAAEGEIDKKEWDNIGKFLRTVYSTAENDMKAVAKGLPFWRLMKELTLLGYFTSEVGIKASFEYVQIPSKLEMIKLKPNQKAYAY